MDSFDEDDEPKSSPIVIEFTTIIPTYTVSVAVSICMSVILFILLFSLAVYTVVQIVKCRKRRNATPTPTKITSYSTTTKNLTKNKNRKCKLPSVDDTSTTNTDEKNAASPTISQSFEKSSQNGKERPANEQRTKVKKVEIQIKEDSEISSEECDLKNRRQITSSTDPQRCRT